MWSCRVDTHEFYDDFHELLGWRMGHNSIVSLAGRSGKERNVVVELDVGELQTITLIVISCWHSDGRGHLQFPA